MFKIFTNRNKETMKDVVNLLDNLRANRIDFKDHNGFDHVNGDAIAYEEIFIERTSNGLITLYEENQGFCLPLYTSENLEAFIDAHPVYLKKLRKVLSKLNKFTEVA